MEGPLNGNVATCSMSLAETTSTSMSPLSGPSISVATPVDSACDDGEDADEVDEIVLVEGLRQYARP
jgi:hypothetical protein